MDWKQIDYGNVKELIPNNIPTPLGKIVTLAMYVDKNLCYNLTNGFLLSGIMHIINGNPFEWISKKQRNAETTTWFRVFIGTNR